MHPSPFGENVFGINTLAPLHRTKTFTEADAVQPPGFVTLTVYNVSKFGFTVIEGVELLTTQLVGDHFTLVTSADTVGVSVIVCPTFIVLFVPAVTVGIG